MFAFKHKFSFEVNFISTVLCTVLSPANFVWDYIEYSENTVELTTQINPIRMYGVEKRMLKLILINNGIQSERMGGNKEVMRV